MGFRAQLLQSSSALCPCRPGTFCTFESWNKNRGNDYTDLGPTGSEAITVGHWDAFGGFCFRLVHLLALMAKGRTLKDCHSEQPGNFKNMNSPWQNSNFGRSECRFKNGQSFNLCIAGTRLNEVHTSKRLWRVVIIPHDSMIDFPASAWNIPYGSISIIWGTQLWQWSQWLAGALGGLCSLPGYCTRTSPCLFHQVFPRCKNVWFSSIIFVLFMILLKNLWYCGSVCGEDPNFDSLTFHFRWRLHIFSRRSRYISAQRVSVQKLDHEIPDIPRPRGLLLDFFLWKHRFAPNSM